MLPLRPEMLVGDFRSKVLYRLGRKMYMTGRGDGANDMHNNGELFVQRSAVAALTRRNEPLVIFDVGANIGDWTLALTRDLAARAYADRAKLYAFEPVPSTANTLRSRLEQQPFQVHVEQVALSSASGVAEIHAVAENAGTNSLHAEPGKHQDRIEIRLTSATDFCHEHSIDHVDLLKCDTEGHDMEVIRGALPLLRDGRISVLQFEYNHRWIYARNFLRDAFTAVAGLPYRVAKLQPSRLLLMSSWHPELERFFEGNYALVHRDALTWFATSEVAFDQSNVLTTSESAAPREGSLDASRRTSV
jgi:FkbM family methyltransferase